MSIIEGNPLAYVCSGCGVWYAFGHEHVCAESQVKSGQDKYENATLNEREKTHGDFANTARIAQKLKALLAYECDMSTSPEWQIQEIQSESLDMICTKIARIISGNGNDPDHWKDIAGYANLVSERLK